MKSRLVQIITLLFLSAFFDFSVGYCLAQNDDDPFPPLNISHIVERTLTAKDDVQVYTVKLQRGEFLTVEVRPSGFDAAIIIVAQANIEEPLKAVDYLDDSDWETLWFEAPETTEYAVLIAGSDFSGEGEYKISATVEPEVSTTDKKRLQAEIFYRKSNDAEREQSLEAAQCSIENLTKAAELWGETKDAFWEATTRNIIGRIYMELSEPQKALEQYKKALDGFKSVGANNGAGYSLNNMGAAYEAIGEKQTALDFFHQAILLFQKTGAKSGEADALKNAAALYALLRENKKAIEFYEKSLALYRAVNYRRGEARVLTGLGVIYSGAGQEQKALELYEQALPLYNETGDVSGEAMTLQNIGALYSKLDQPGRAFGNFTRALFLFKGLGDKRGEAITLKDIAITWALMGNRRLSVFFGKQAINAFQDLRGRIRGLDKVQQRGFLRSVEDNYRIFAYEMIESGRLAEAFQVLNFLKDQEFFDYIATIETASGNISVRYLELTQSEKIYAEKLDKIARLMWDIGVERQELRRKIRQEPNDVGDAVERLGSLRPEEQELTGEYIELIKQLEQEGLSPTFSDTLKTNSDVAQLQAALKEISSQTGQKAVALSALVGKNFRLLMITSDEIKVIKHPIKENELNKKTLEFLKLLNSPNFDPRPTGKALYDIILKPAEPELEKTQPQILVWFLDGNLRYIPTAALFDGERYLAERYNNVVFTRADRERMTRAVSPVWTATGFGSSKESTVKVLGEEISFNALPGVNEELSAIFKNEKGGIFEGAVFPDQKFSKQNFLAALKAKRPLVHIASHFAFRPGDEARSFLLMGDGTALTLEEMKQERNLFEAVELLTLSACETAAQQPGANGREVDGFAELAQRLGAGAVMASLWAVADESTAVFMSNFYRIRHENPGMTKAEAMRLTQKAMIEGKLTASKKWLDARSVKVKTKDDETKAEPYKFDEAKPFAHPFYWSPFVLIGNWK